ncbi:MAG: D-alanyl-D-alanine carboxypeptidase DacF precursor [Syntrophorhabdaceae bacterium PtaU1.Bin034]|nr:MAG: D-alanyl-D-alanine carboxypeptidase DacF precursor [Syntrophorhabdaceae bacterium PtaU1.Bin034]
MKNHLVRHLVVFATILSFFFFADAAFAKRGAVKKGHVRQAVAAKAEKTAEGPCKAYIIMEATSGKVLEEQNMHEKRPPASMTKLMVAYIVLDKIAKGEIHLTDKIHVSREASKIGGSQVYLKEGEEFALEDMMKAILIASGNDAAYAVAEQLAGSSKDFVNLMNETAQSIGMKDTEFNSVHGLPPGKDQQEDLTSCYDMALLGRYILKYPKVLEWTSTKTGEFRGGSFVLNNHNKLLTRMPEVDGFKTGYYRSTGFNVVATAKKGELRFIAVVMGSPTGKMRDDLAMEKLRKYFAEYMVLNLAKKGEQVEKDVVLEDGKFRKIKGVTAADLNLPLIKGKKKDVKRVINLPYSVKGEVKQGQKLGEMLFQLDNEVVGKIDIVSPVYVPKANIFTRMVRKVGLNL